MVKLGQIVMTARISEDVANNDKFSREITIALAKYIQCDWGDTCKEDCKTNDNAYKNNNDRIFAVYNTSKGVIWIITESDRSVTTILYPDEY